MATDKVDIEYIELLKSDYIEKSKNDFWRFCNVLSPDFYTPKRKHLEKLCDTLQAFYERKLLNVAGEPYEKLIIELPPRHGKSRTLTNFSSWILGKDESTKIITASYSDDLAQDFSRHTRDIISAEKNTKDEMIYSDIFKAKIKQGDSAYKKWALEGQHFNYKGCGVGGSITGRGGNILLIDDPIKDAETAYNEDALEKIWRWYTGTFMSRAEEGALQILCMTPWCKNDLGAKLQKLEKAKCFVLSMPAVNKDGEMLCPDLLSKQSYNDRKAIADRNIFSANYDMVRLDSKGSLYSSFETYKEMPKKITGRVGYTDTADEGKDYLCSIHGNIVDNYIYITDIIYTQDAQEITEPLLCDVIESEKTKELTVESNNGGRGFARNIQRILEERKFGCDVKWFHQTHNKKSRILTNAPVVQKYVLFPEGWENIYPTFYTALMSYQKEGKNKHDDAPDALTGIVEKYGVGVNRVSVPSTNIRARIRI